MPGNTAGTSHERLAQRGKRLHKDKQDINVFYSQGSFAEYVVVHESSAIKVRPDAPPDVVCLLSCRITTGVGSVVNRDGVRAGESVVIFGCGVVGLGAVMGAKLCGAETIAAGAVGFGTNVTTSSYYWPEPLPFPELAGPEFPLEALPEDLRQIVAAHAEGLQVPLGMSSTLALVTLCAVLGGKIVVQPRLDWREPVNEFGVIVLPPSERKSAAFRTWIAPLEERERELVAAALPKIEEANANLDVLKQRLSDAKRALARAHAQPDAQQQAEAEATMRDLTRQVAEFQIPKTPRFLADDATPEAAASLLADHEGRILIASSEGGLFETIAGRYSDHVPNLDVYLKGHSGDPLRVDRKSRPSEFVPNPALSLILTVQPVVVEALEERKLFLGRGLLSRFLYEIPRPRRGYRKVEPEPMAEHLQQSWGERVQAIIRLPPSKAGEELVLKLNADAAQLFRRFRERVEEGLRPSGKYSPIEDWGGKFAGHVLRLAAGIHFWEHIADPTSGGPLAWNQPISATTMQRAIVIGDHYADHAQVAYAMMREGGHMEQARQLWAYLEHRGQLQITFRDLWRQLRRRYESIEELRGVLARLESLGYLQVVQVGPGSQGGRASTLVSLNPAAIPGSGDVGDKTPPLDLDNQGSVTDVTGNESDAKHEEAREFQPTSQWLEVPEGYAVPDSPELEVRMNPATGRNEARTRPALSIRPSTFVDECWEENLQ